MATITEQFKRARRVSTPLIGIKTPDPGATIEAIADAINGDAPKVQWDFVRGLRARNEQGKEVISEVLSASEGFDPTVNNPAKLMELLPKAPSGAMVFVLMSNRFLKLDGVTQGIWNLRDAFKQDHRTLILLGPDFTLPAELTGDVIVYDEPLPTGDEIKEIISELCDSAEISVNDDTMTRAIDATQGLPAFAIEQITAISLTKDGIDLDNLWERKRRQIEETAGLRVYRGNESFDSIGGYDEMKFVLSQLFNGPDVPNTIVFVDEIEKMIAGHGTDTSGVSTDQVGCLLSYMEDHKATGFIFVGPPGCAKSMFAKAAGNEFGVPTIQYDLGGMKGSLVGESEQMMRGALKVTTAVSNDKTLWIATSNNIKSLPPELIRRFKLGVFYFDRPSADERPQIWSIFEKQYAAMGYDFSEQERPADDLWTGAEIARCCDLAWRLQLPLKEAAKRVIPVAKSARNTIDALETLADGNFLSSSYPGAFHRDASADTGPKKTKKKRSISITSE